MKTAIYNVIKDENDYLEDFIRYHLDLGVDALFIFEDIGSKSHKAICDRYQNVTLKPISDLFDEKEMPDIIRKKNEGRFLQSEYAHRGLMWIKNNHSDIDWCFSLDCDEYITVTEPFPAILERYNAYDGIMLYWKNFGASGRIYKPEYDKPIWEIFTQPCNYSKGDWRSRNISKMAFNMHRLKNEYIYGVHTALCNWVRTDFKTNRTEEPTFEVMYLRHYITKSWEEYKWKLDIRGMQCVNNRKYEHFFEMNPDMLPLKDELLKIN